MTSTEFWSGWPGAIIAFLTLWGVFELLEAAYR